MKYDSIRLEIFKHQFSSVAEEMGMVLQRTAYSPNIKERRDFSCALFDKTGQMIAQAAHIPVHLGAMPLSVKTAIERIDFRSGDAVILNDPYCGGTHLPDITLISPVFINRELFAFVANRAHHSDVGGIAPGSMPLSREIFQEGIIIPPIKLVQAGQINQSVWDFIMTNVRTPEERSGDIKAQIAANIKGERCINQLVARYGQTEISRYMKGLLDYAKQMTQNLIEQLPDGSYSFFDYMDDDGVSPEPVKIAVAVTIKGQEATVDFTGSSTQCKGNINMVEAITLSAVYYVFRCLIGLDIPSNSGCLMPIKVIAPKGIVVNADFPAAVAAGNVETSQRVVDVLLGALSQACPERVPAASQGTMNNITLGGWDSERNKSYAYYETIGGGMGALPDKAGTNAIQSHMTNTMNTPIEALEYDAYPFQIKRYEARQNSEGKGYWKGGNGICREIELLEDAQVTILSDRRKFSPYGLAGGKAGQRGNNILIRGGKEKKLPGKTTLKAKAGDVIRISTPGGGGYGQNK